MFINLSFDILHKLLKEIESASLSQDSSSLSVSNSSHNFVTFEISELKTNSDVEEDEVG